MATNIRLKIRPWSPTPEQAEFLRTVEPTRQFLNDLPAEVLKVYAGQWIAARDGRIVAAAATRAKLAEALGDADDPATLKLRLEAGIRIRWHSRSSSSTRGV
jgi:hypothetical protein